jgi:hypothetical protein
MMKVSRHIVDVAGEDSSRVGLGIDTGENILNVRIKMLLIQ